MTSSNRCWFLYFIGHSPFGYQNKWLIVLCTPNRVTLAYRKYTFFATKWKKNTEEYVKLFIKIKMLGESVEKKDVFGSEEITLGKEATIAALNIDVTQMVVKADSRFHAFEVMYKYNKQRKYRSAAVLPFSIQNLNERKEGAEKEE